MKFWMRIVTFVAAISMLMGCFLMGGDDEPQNNGGVINFSINNSFESRTIEPNLDVIPSSYRVIGNGPNGASFNEVVTETEFNIEFLIFGDWQVSIEVMNADNYVFARGSGNTTVNVGEESNLEITTTMLDGDGTLDLTFTYPVALVQNPNVELSLIDDLGNVINLPSVDGGINTGLQTLNVTGVTLSSGYYTLIAQIIDLGISGTQSHIVMGTAEVVRIIQDQTTTGTINLTGVMGTGSIGMTLVNDLNEVISAEINVSEGIPQSFAFDSGIDFTLNGSIPASDEDINNVTYTWFINGEFVSAGANYNIDSNNCPLNQNRNGQFLAGDYRVDLVVINADGSRGGSATYEFTVTGNTALITVGERGSVSGVVGYMNEDLNGAIFVPLSGATVTAGSVTVTSNIDGSFSLSGVTGGRAVVSLSAAGYLSNHKTISIIANNNVDLQRVILLEAESFTFNSSVDNAYLLNNGVGAVDFPANSIADESGNPYNGPVTINTSAINPSLPGFFDMFPGDFTGVTTVGDSVDIISFGVVTVELEDADGNPLQLREGSTAEIRMQVPDPANAPATMPLWYFDEATGNWIEDGVATLVGDYYVGNVTHFTSWNFDYPIPTGEDGRYGRGYLSGRVVDENGNPVADAQVVFTGMSDVAWETTATTDANGNFSNIQVYVNRTDTTPLYSGFAIKDGIRSRRELIEVNSRNISNIVLELRNPPIELTVDARRGFRTQRVESEGAFLRFGDSTSDAFITLTNEDANGLEVSDISITGADSFDIITAMNYPMTIDNGTVRTFMVRFTYAQNLGSVTADLVITSNSVVNPVYTIRLEGGSDLTQPMTQTSTVSVVSWGTGAVERSASGVITANNVWNNTGTTISESADAAFRVCLGFDLTVIPAGAIIESVTLNAISIDHNGLQIYQGTQGELLDPANFDPANNTQLSDLLFEVGTPVTFNAGGNRVVQSFIGNNLPLLLVASDAAFGVIDLTSPVLTITYSY